MRDQMTRPRLAWWLCAGALALMAVVVAGQLFGGLGDRPPSWAVAGATLAVVDQTVAPTRASLWLRSPTPRPPGRGRQARS